MVSHKFSFSKTNKILNFFGENIFSFSYLHQFLFSIVKTHAEESEESESESSGSEESEESESEEGNDVKQNQSSYFSNQNTMF